MSGPPPTTKARAWSGAYQQALRLAGSALLLLSLGLATSHASSSGDAERLLRSGDLSAAWQAAQHEAEASPDDLDVQERLIDIALALGVQDLVVPRLRDDLKARPDRAASHYLLGRVALEAPEAEAHYQAALKRDPNFSRAHMGLGAIRRADGQLDEAVKLYRRALNREPTLSEAWAGLQASLLQQGDMQGALEAAKEATQVIPTEPDPYIAAATLEPARARETLEIGVKTVGNDPRLYAMLARVYLDSGEGEEAQQALLEALKLAPNYAEAGYLFLVAREIQEKRLDPEGWRALQAAQAEKDPDKARVAFDDMVGRYPNSALAWLGLGKVRAEAGDLEAGALDLARAASLSRGEPEVLANQGLVLLRAGRADEAFPPLHAAVKQRPADVSLTIAAIEAATGAGRKQDARKVAVDGLKRHPQDLRMIFQTAKVLSNQGDREGAYLVLRDSLKNQPDPRLIVALAAAARDAGYYAEAAEILDRLSKVMDLPRAKELADQLKQEALIRGKTREREGPNESAK